MGVNVGTTPIAGAALGGIALSEQAVGTEVVWPSDVPPNPLLLALNFDEPAGLTVIDYSGLGNDVTMTSPTQRSLTNFHSGIAAGTEGLIVAGGPSGNLMSDFQPLDRSTTFWASRQGDGVWVVRWQVTAADTGAFGVYEVGTIRARFSSAAGTSYNVDPGFGVDDDWHHYGLTYHSVTGLGSFYLDGDLVGTTTVPGGGPLRTADFVDVDGDANGIFVDDLRIYNTAISDTQVTSDMNTPIEA